MSCLTNSSKKLGLAISGIVLASIVAGCASSRFDTNPAPVVHPQQQRAAPLGEVSQSDLPPVEGQEQMPTDEPNHLTNVMEPINAVDLAPSHVSGMWRVNVDDTTCQVATPQTKSGKGFRANALHCPTAFANAGSWNVDGKQLKFYNKNGDDLAVLYSTDTTHFSGLLKSGDLISLSR